MTNGIKVRKTVTEKVERTVKQAVKIILCLRSTKFDTDTFVLHREITDIQLCKEWIPSYLRCFCFME